MNSWATGADDPSDAARMLLDLCTGGYHDRMLYDVETQNRAIERREAARMVQQFSRCYSPEGQSAWAIPSSRVGDRLRRDFPNRSNRTIDSVPIADLSNGRDGSSAAIRSLV
jgi:hypothetical protein